MCVCNYMSNVGVCMMHLCVCVCVCVCAHEYIYMCIFV